MELARCVAIDDWRAGRCPQGRGPSGV